MGRGTEWARETRSECNALTDSEREALLNKALQIAYAAETKPAAPVRSRRR